VTDVPTTPDLTPMLREDDPLPRRRLLGGPVVSGSIKDRAEDFLVDEIPLYEPSGEGEHLYLGIQRQGMAHSEMLEVLGRHFGVPEEAIGFAGMKDKIAVIRQAVSIHLPGRATPAVELRNDRLAILWQRRHLNKIRRGHLAGNRFSIRIRKIDPIRSPVIWRGLKTLERDGIPDYYGSQRFGYRRNNHRLGRHLLNGDPEAMLDELLGTVSPFPERQREARELFDAKRYAESLPLWGRNDRAERVALNALVHGRSPRAAAKAISPAMRMFWISAYQSAVFNRLLDQRLERGLLATIIEGDVAYKHASRGQFTVTAEMLAAEDLQARAGRFEISPSGPMLGRGMIEAAGQVRDWELEATLALGVRPEVFAAKETDLEGARRPFRVPVTNIELEGGFDEHGTFIRLAFDLPRGAYATVLLRELLGDEVAENEDAALADRAADRSDR
jgi:tRNA pseudouridine13 synthase